MYKLKVIRHSDISRNDIDEIIHIKHKAWPYSYLDQVKWIEDNIETSDLHVLLLNNEDAIAYLNLINIELTIDENIYYAFGIGNVCATERGKGYGKELMLHTNHYLRENNKIGLLICKQNLVSFYKGVGWKPIEKENTRVNIPNPEHVYMCFNIEKIENRSIMYNGRLF